MFSRRGLTCSGLTRCWCVSPPASQRTGLSRDILQSLILANFQPHLSHPPLPKSPPQMLLRTPGLLLPHTPDHSPVSTPPWTWWPRLSLHLRHLGFQACVLHSSLFCHFLVWEKHTHTQNQLFSSRPTHDGTSSGKSSQNFPAPPLL